MASTYKGDYPLRKVPHKLVPFIDGDLGQIERYLDQTQPDRRPGEPWRNQPMFSLKDNDPEDHDNRCDFCGTSWMGKYHQEIVAAHFEQQRVEIEAPMWDGEQWI